MIYQILLPLTAVVAAIAGVGAFYVRDHGSSRTRSAALVAMCAVVFTAPLCLECLIAAVVHRPHVLWVDLHLQWLVIPPGIGLLTAWLVLRRQPQRGATLTLLGWFAFFGVANTFNACAPGWCGRYGFPFAYFSWSDAIVSFNGESSSPFSLAGGAVDVLVILAGAFVIRRRGLQVAAPDFKFEPQHRR